MSQLKRHFSPPMIISAIALFVALGGAAYAGFSLPNNSVRSNHIKNGQVKTGDLANFAVTPIKIQNNAVKTNKLRDNAVTTAKILNGAVTNPKIGDGAVTTAKIADGAVNSAKISNGSIASADVAAGFQVPGMLAAHARVMADGTLEPNQFRNIAQANVEHPLPGVYCFGGLSFTLTNAMVSSDNATVATADLDRVVSVAVSRGIALADCGAAFQQARVRVVDVVDGTGTPVPEDGRFYIWFLS